MKHKNDIAQFRGRLAPAVLNGEAWVWVFLRLVISLSPNYNYEDADEIVRMIQCPDVHR